ncbi:MAG: anti-sigma factor, partial [Verrucomicrobiota bacterium]
MNLPSKEERFEWLDAGRALGDLTPEEEAEWRSLAETLGKETNANVESEISLDAIVASLEQGLSPDASLPESLQEQISEGAKDFQESSGGESDKAIVRPSFWSRPALGWAAAAVLALLLIVQTMTYPRGEEPAVPSLIEQVESDPNLLRRSFATAAGGDAELGEVLWSDSQQQGVMLLSGLPENDPAVSQYQLWIVDPTRDVVHPVDGGVFDIQPTSSGPLT